MILVDAQSKTVNIYQKGKREVMLFEFDEEFEIIEGLKIKMEDIIS